MNIPKKYKIAISILLVLALTIGIVSVTLTLIPQKADAIEYRGGFSLIPEASDDYGIKMDTSFILKSQNAISLAKIIEVLTIDNEPNPIITEIETNAFKITPSKVLRANSLYTFRIVIEENEIKWVFQTEKSFIVIGSLPADKSSNVPINTGIEIYFSYEDFENYEQFFEITPKVSGKFEVHKQVLVFVPDKLEPGTLYEIKLKKGLSLKNSDKNIREDFVFRFETQENEAIENNRNNTGYFSFSSMLSEYRANENPNLEFYYYINNPKTDVVTVDATLYKYDDIDSFIEAVENKFKVPGWAYISSQKNEIPIKGLSKILSFSQEFPTERRNYNEPPFLNIPEKLQKGFYLVDSYWNDIHFQTFIQITDIGSFTVISDTDSLIWLNNLETKNPISNAIISNNIDSINTTSNNDGLVKFIAPNSDADIDQIIFKVNAASDESIILYSVPYYRYYGNSEGSKYWTYNYLDRNLYKPDDYINFWGLIKNRYTDENLEELTVEITRGGYFYMGIMESYKGGFIPFNSNTLLKKDISLSNGVYSDKIWLENLATGSYQFVVKSGDTILVNNYFSIENYNKPNYKIEIEKSKNAIFYNEEVVFDIKSLFFEGTPVAGLDFNYNIYGYGLENSEGSGKTDSNGNATIKYTPKLQGNNNNLSTYVTINVYASLPEIGEIYKTEDVHVFLNDINVAYTSNIKDNTGTIEFKLNEIVLDNLNNGTSDNNQDYLGNPVVGRLIKGTIYRNTWLKIEDGNEYDYINKTTIKRYRYERNKEPVNSFSQLSDSEGKFLFQFNVNDFNENGGYYSFDYQVSDNKGRQIKGEDGYIAIDYPRYPSTYEDNRYYLETDKDKYLLDEKINISFKKGKNLLPNGKYLFIEAQNGIRNEKIQSTALYSTVLNTSHIPQIGVYGIYFDGNRYIIGQNTTVNYDFSEKELFIEVVPDKDSYKPGDEVKLDIIVKDKDGNPVPANVNISLVDEALFALRDQSINTLENLYSYVPDGIRWLLSSHGASQNREEAIDSGSVRFDMVMGEPTESSKSLPTAESGAAQDANIREDFKDTAVFINIVTDNNGKGNSVFKLPDNITSWRITMSAINNTLQAGSTTNELKVSMPMFINYSLATVYLAGDKPILDVSAYGDQLIENQIITFKVYKNNDKNPLATIDGKAFEKNSIPLWEFTDDMKSITIEAFTSDGLSDGIKHPVKVVNSYHEFTSSISEIVVKNMNIKGGKGNNTKLLFTGGESGELYNMLFSISWNSGNRLDQVLPSNLAQTILMEKIEDYVPWNKTVLKLKDYQNTDGGFGILPYAESDPKLTVNLLQLLDSGFDKDAAKNYLYANIGNNVYSDSMLLYGLASLGEPVLINLDKLNKIENLPTSDRIYIALAYNSIGEKETALKIYNEKIYPESIENDEYNFINTEKDIDENLILTAQVLVLTSRLGLDDSESYFKYLKENMGKEVLVRMEKSIYINSLKDNILSEDISIKTSYLGQVTEIDLSNGNTYYLEIPSSKLSELKINEVIGSAQVISTFTSPLISDPETSNDINVTRKYLNIDNRVLSPSDIKSGDIIKIQLDWSISKNAPTGEYEVADYLPSGLVPIENSYKYGREDMGTFYYKKISNQKVSFYIYNYNDLRENSGTLTYLARVISKGVYSAEGTIIQKTNTNTYLNITNSEIVIIN